MVFSNITSIFIFFVIMIGLGSSLVFLFKKHYNPMVLGYGIAAFSVLSCGFAILRIPIKWYYFLGISLIIPVYVSIKYYRMFVVDKYDFQLLFKKVKIVHLFLLMIFLFNMIMLCIGSFSYTLYEDGDPYKHSGISKYIAVTGSALEPIKGENILQYIDSYPPSYDILMSIMYQVSDNLIWTLKFFNALLISLGIIFFYYFVKEFCGSEKTALYSTIILSFIPAYASHFIWAISLATCLIFPLFYALEKKFYGIASVCFAAVLLSQPTHAVSICGLLAIYLAFNWKEYQKTLSVVCGGVLASIVWYVPMYFRYGSLSALLSGAGTTVTNKATEFGFRFVGSADRVYIFKDYFFASAQNQINQPIGIGIVAFILVIVGIYFLVRKKDE